jgi:tRNA-dihydrouridine synthase
MYTGTADHTFTAELVDRVGIPVIASGDIADRVTAEHVLDATGAAAVMVGRGAQGRPWALREMAGEGEADADAAEVVAELIRFMREVEREMGDRAGIPGAKAIRGALVTCATVEDAERELIEFRPDASALVAAHEAELELLPDSGSDRLLELPISIYGGG